MIAILLEAYCTVVRSADTPNRPSIAAANPPSSSNARPEALATRPKEPSVAVTLATPPARNATSMSLPIATSSLPTLAKPSPPESDSTSEMAASKPVNEKPTVFFAIASANV